nr:MAG TPA: ssDNA binding protein [Caudoviricetes sp.]
MCEGITFITEQGAYFSQSDGIARCAKNLIMAYGSDFAAEPITIEFTERKLGGGRKLKQFIVL